MPTSALPGLPTWHRAAWLQDAIHDATGSAMPSDGARTANAASSRRTTTTRHASNTTTAASLPASFYCARSGRRSYIFRWLSWRRRRARHRKSALRMPPTTLRRRSAQQAAGLIFGARDDLLHAWTIERLKGSRSGDVMQWPPAISRLRQRHCDAPRHRTISPPIDGRSCARLSHAAG